jgi:hypothetical protein
VDGDRTPPVVTGRTHLDLHVPRARLRERQRHLDHQLVESVTLDRPSRVQRQRHDRGPRHHHRPRQHMVAQPRVRGRIEAPGEHHAVRPGQPHRLAEERARPWRRPIPTVPERVGREVDRAAGRDGSRGGQKPPPIDRSAVDPRLGQARSQARRPAVAAPQGADRRGGLPVEQGRHQDRVGADLEEQPGPDGRGEPLHGAVEPHGLPQVAEPVGRVEPVGIDRSTGDGRPHRHPGPSGRDAVEGDDELLAQRVDVGGMGRVVDRDQRGHDALGLAARDQLGHRVPVARHGHRGRAVHRGDAESGSAAQQLGRPPLVGGDRRHRAAAR